MRLPTIIGYYFALVAFVPALGQTPLGTVFTYQGQLKEDGVPASGSYDLQFTLWNHASTGAAVAGPIAVANHLIVNGLFTVPLDFGMVAFNGSARWLQIGVRPGSGVDPDPYTSLNPRQALTVTPHAILALNSTQLGGIAASEYVTTTGAGNTFIENGTTPQPTSNFNITGNGTAGSLKINGATSLGGIAPPATAPAGQGRIYFDSASNKLKISENNSAFVNLVGASGVGGSGTTNSIPFWSAGTMLGNSQITQSANGVQLPNGVQLAAGAQGNHVALGSPNGETGMSISGATGRADVRFDGTTLKLFAGPAGGPPSNGITVTSSNVQLPNNVQLGVGAQGNQVQFGSPNSETGLSISGASGRADLRFDGTLKLVNGPGGIPPATNGIAINPLGNVGMGTLTPNAKLAVNGGPLWTSNGWSGSLSMSNASALGWEANASGQRFGIGQSTGGLYFFRTNSALGTTGSPANYDMQITDSGNLVQTRDKGGLVKAMIFVNSNHTIVRCFNGVTGSSTGTCGFSIANVTVGNGPGFRIFFNFQVDDRFVSVSPQEAFGTSIGATFKFINSTTIDVRTFSTDVDYVDSNALNPFMIFVY